MVLAGASHAFHLSVMQEGGQDSPGEAKGLAELTVRTADAETMLPSEPAMKARDRRELEQHPRWK